MPRLFEHKQHLVRVALLFAAGLLVFLIAKAVLVPADFGVFGHYRAGALADNQNLRPLAHAGRAACAECHVEEAKTLAGGRHAHIGCEACHGPLAPHAADPTTVPGSRPDPRATCLHCHQANVARPPTFPQIEPSDHAATGPCTECHAPHAPSL